MWIFLLFFQFAFSQAPKCFENVKGSLLDEFEKNQILEEEILTRLILAEGLSTNYPSHDECKTKGSEIFEAIAWGVMARVKMSEHNPTWANKYGKGIKGVIFHKNQFNPAISEKSPYSVYFRCPSKANNFNEHWKWATLAMRTAVDNPMDSPFIKSKWEKKNSIPLVSHFYYPLSKQASKTPPDWADRKKHPRAVFPDLMIRDKYIPETCILFFRHEKPLNKDGR